MLPWLSFSKKQGLVVVLLALGVFCMMAPKAHAAGPGLSISSGLTETESHSGLGNPVSFSVTLSAASTQTITVNVNTTDGTAKASTDYSTTSLTLNFAPGETVKNFTVPIVGDTLDENNETFYVFLSSPTNASISQGRGIGTIFDDDAQPSITIDNVNIGEGSSGQRVAAFRLSLSSPSGKVVRVSYATANGTSASGSDYGAVAPTSIAFTVGSNVAYGRVFINGDALFEANETFLVNLSTPQNATVADAQAIGTILNDDRAPALTINDVSLSEGTGGTKVFTFTVNLSAASGQTIRVNYATVNGTATASTAASSFDYTATTGTLTIAPGQISGAVSVVVNSDQVFEGNESFYVLLSNAVNASIGRARGMATIVNDDSSVGPR